MKAKVGEKAPFLSVSEWVKGEPTNIDQLSGHVVLIEIFQVNCPGCFLYALPQAISWYQKYTDQGLRILAVATAFEDFDKNTLENLKALIEEGTVIGETKKVLEMQNKLLDGKLPFRIPFPVAMDRLAENRIDNIDAAVESFIEQRVPNFVDQADDYQKQVRQQVHQYFANLKFKAETFDLYDLKGTPSHILIDKQGILREQSFGNSPELESVIEELLEE